MTSTTSRTQLRRYLAVVAADGAADGTFYAALGFAAAMTSPALTAAVLASGALARAAVVLVGGAAGDRWGLRRVGVLTFTGRLVALLLGAFLVAVVGPSPWLLVLLAVTVGVLDALNAPAVFGLAGLIAGSGDQSRVRGRSMATSRIATALGAAGCGVLLAWDASAALVGAGALLAAGLMALSRLGVGGPPEPAPGGGAGSGGPRSLLAIAAGALRWARTSRPARATLAVFALVNAATAGPVFVGLPLRAAEADWSGTAYGAAFGALSIGLAAGGWWTNWLMSRVGGSALTLLAAQPATLVLLSVSSSPILTATSVFVLGVTAGAAGASLIGAVAETLPDDAMGQWQALVTGVATVSVPLSHAAYGVMVASVSLTFAGAVMAGFLAVALWWAAGARR